MYRFENLEHKLIAPDFNIQVLYDLTVSISSNDYHYYSEKKAILLVLDELLSDDVEYFVMHERILVKGRLRKFIGHVVIAKKISIIKYIEKSLNENDLRPIRIFSPSSPNKMLRFSEDSVLFVYDIN